jgi:uncharacterized protein (DUF2225 family)
MKSEVPVFMTKVECPVCKTVNEYETIKFGAYTEEGRDSDFCPAGRIWRNPKYQHINPLLYFMATCASCFYTRELNKNFKEWKSDSTFRSFRRKAIREKHLNQMANPNGLVEPLGTGLDPENAPNETAIVKLLLGILSEQLLDRPSALDLGRWYLRIAWLFREMAGESHGRIDAEQVQRVRLQTMLTALRETFDRCRHQIEDIRSLVDQQPQVGPPAEDPYRTAMSNWRSNLEPILKSVDDLLTWRGDVTAQSAAPAAALSSGAFGGHHSFNAFLESIAGRNQVVPTNESEAISRSLQFYRQAYEESREISGGNQKIQVAYMIGELARRTGEIDQAREYLYAAMRTGQEFIHQHRNDAAKTALARKILEMAVEQTRKCTDAGSSGS